MNNEHIIVLEKAYSLITQANVDMIDNWVKYTFLTWQWWFGLSLAIIPWTTWIIFRKKESTDRLLLAGFLVIIISSWFDLIGILFGLWSYHYNVIPVSPSFAPWDFTLLPVSIMFLLQIKPQINPIIKGIMFAAFSSFIIEPFFVWIGLYNPKHWEHIYSFPVILVIYLVADSISKRSKFERLQN